MLLFELGFLTSFGVVPGKSRIEDFCPPTLNSLVQTTVILLKNILHHYPPLLYDRFVGFPDSKGVGSHMVCHRKYIRGGKLPMTPGAGGGHTNGGGGGSICWGSWTSLCHMLQDFQKANVIFLSPKQTGLQNEEKGEQGEIALEKPQKMANKKGWIMANKGEKGLTSFLRPHFKSNGNPACCLRARPRLFETETRPVAVWSAGEKVVPEVHRSKMNIRANKPCDLRCRSGGQYNEYYPQTFELIVRMMVLICWETGFLSEFFLLHF